MSAASNLNWMNFIEMCNARGWVKPILASQTIHKSRGVTDRVTAILERRSSCPMRSAATNELRTSPPSLNFEDELPSQHFIQQARGRRPPASGYKKLECAHAS